MKMTYKANITMDASIITSKMKLNFETNHSTIEMLNVNTLKLSILKDIITCSPSSSFLLLMMLKSVISYGRMHIMPLILSRTIVMFKFIEMEEIIVKYHSVKLQVLLQ